MNLREMYIRREERQAALATGNHLPRFWRARDFLYASPMPVLKRMGVSVMIFFNPFFPMRAFHALSVLCQNVASPGIKLNVSESASEREVPFFLRLLSICENPFLKDMVLVVL